MGTSSSSQTRLQFQTMHHFYCRIDSNKQCMLQMLNVMTMYYFMISLLDCIWDSGIMSALFLQAWQSFKDIVDRHFHYVHSIIFWELQPNKWEGGLPQHIVLLDNVVDNKTRWQLVFFFANIRFFNGRSHSTKSSSISMQWVVRAVRVDYKQW